jgi:hypothetical protein
MDSVICESSVRNQKENKNIINKLVKEVNNNKYIIKEHNLGADNNFINEQKKEKEKEKQLEKNERETIKKDIPSLSPKKRKSSAFRPYTFKEEDKNENFDLKSKINKSRKSMNNLKINLKRKSSTNISPKRESKNNVIIRTSQKIAPQKNTPKNTPKNTSKNTPRSSKKNTPIVSGRNSIRPKQRKSKMNSPKDNKLNELLSNNSKLVLVTNEANNNNNNLIIENSLLNDSGSFGHFQESNILETL